jgi:hypothetical protein
MSSGLPARAPRRGAGALVVGLVLWFGSSAPAQTADEPVPPSTAMDVLTGSNLSVTGTADGVIQASCGGCGGNGGLVGVGPVTPIDGAGCSGCGRSPCVPGKKPCEPCVGETWLGRFGCCLYECICCVDPCYEPRYLPIADAAFFVESARPQTQQRLRWEYGANLEFPDRAEYFWAQQNLTQVAGPPGKGPVVRLIPLSVPGRTPPVQPIFRGEPKVQYNELSVYTEVASSLLSFFTEMPYRSLNTELGAHAAGFGDMNLGTKSLLYDCELLQLTFQFKTYLPVGNFLKGLGNGHVSLEPSVILNVNCGPDSYVQSQLAEWVPLGGTPGYAGALLHYHLSYNHVLCRPLADVPLIGTMEFNGWSFQNGSYTDPILGANLGASGTTYFSIGPGARLVVCDKFDFGVGTAFSVTAKHWASTVIRSEIRWRF